LGLPFSKGGRVLGPESLVGLGKAQCSFVRKSLRAAVPLFFRLVSFLTKVRCIFIYSAKKRAKNSGKHLDMEGK
jgi:hypothetical protein